MNDYAAMLRELDLSTVTRLSRKPMCNPVASVRIETARSLDQRAWRLLRQAAVTRVPPLSCLRQRDDFELRSSS
jgi:hypothetical protein